MFYFSNTSSMSIENFASEDENENIASPDQSIEKIT
jgi:hypothetical protein